MSYSNSDSSSIFNKGHEDPSEDDCIDKCFTKDEVQIAKSALLLVNITSRETRRLISQCENNNLCITFNKVLECSKATNKELVQLLEIIRKFNHQHLNINSLVKMKFTSQDKYLSQVVYLYFKIVENNNSRLNKNDKIDILNRYIYLINSGIAKDLMTYDLFKTFMKSNPEMFKYFLNRNLYFDFPFIKDLIMDIPDLLKYDMFKIGYDIPNLRDLIYNIRVNDYYKDWVFQRWDIRCHYTIPELYYRFDTVSVMEDMGKKRFVALIDPYDVILNDLKGIEHDFNVNKIQQEKVEENFLKGKESIINDELSGLCSLISGINIQSKTEKCCYCDIRVNLETYLRIKDELTNKINLFNEKGVLERPLSMHNIRLFPSINLKVLGEYIGKEKNIQELRDFLGSYDFTEMNIYDSIRFFLSGFILPGESQIIERVITEFGVRFVRCNQSNQQDDDSELILKYKQVAYGFLVLNTMFFNPLYDKHSSFEDFLEILDFTVESGNSIENNRSYFSFSPLDRDSLKVHYDHLKENEIKAPFNWTDGFDKFKIFLTMASTDKSDSIIYKQQGIKDNNLLSLNCYICKYFAYRTLFTKCGESFFFLSPNKFLNLCLIMNSQSIFEKYMVTLKREPLFESFILYFTNFKCNTSIFIHFISSLNDVFDKSKGLLKMFSKSSTDWLSLIQNVKQIKFKNCDVCIHNSRVFNTFIRTNTQNGVFVGLEPQYDSNLEMKTNASVIEILRKILVNNGDFDLCSYDGYEFQIVKDIFYLDPEKNKNSKAFDDSIKLSYLKVEFEERRFTDENISIFESLEPKDQDAFDCYCYLQSAGLETKPAFTVEFCKQDGISIDASSPSIKKINEFKNITEELKNKNTSLVKEENNSIVEANKSHTNTPVCIWTELYPIPLRNPDNILKLFTSSRSILNISVCKQIHKSSCPLNSTVYTNYIPLIYLIMKSDDSKVISYAGYIFNYLSDSLILLIDIINFIYPLLLQSNEHFREMILKILFKRIKMYKKNSISCCSQNNQNCEKSIKDLLDKLIADKMITGMDVPSSLYSNEMEL